jgi:hypothetical protein
VFTDDQIDAYMELKWEEVYNWEHQPAPIESRCTTRSDPRFRNMEGPALRALFLVQESRPKSEGTQWAGLDDAMVTLKRGSAASAPPRTMSADGDAPRRRHLRHGSG